MKPTTPSIITLFEYSVWGLLFLVWFVFSLSSDKFLTLSNLTNIGIQSASMILLTIGMTFVILTAGIDLSVGAIMFVAAAVAGKLAVMQFPFVGCVAIMLLAGVTFGMLNGAVVTRFHVIPFVVTLATLYIGRGTGLWITETRAINLPESFLAVGSGRWLGVPFPFWIVIAVVVICHLVLNQTVFGRQIMAIGHDRLKAERAGIATRHVLLCVYALSGLLAGLSTLLSLGQLGTVSPTFGENREFAAIAAAVIGGTSLAGGRGSIFPGAVLGSLIMQSVENGLVILNADPYLYPIIMSGIIFVAVLLDVMRTRWLERLQRRAIFHEP
jgi:ribose transport system permease protein